MTAQRVDLRKHRAALGVQKREGAKKKKKKKNRLLEDGGSSSSAVGGAPPSMMKARRRVLRLSRACSVRDVSFVASGSWV